MKVKHIDSFMFEKATYRIFDKKRREALFHVFYKDNTFEIEYINGLFDRQARHELQIIAQDLLLRKHNKNFAEKA